MTGESNRLADSCLGLTNDGFLTKSPAIDLKTGDFNTIESRLWSKLIDQDNGFWSEIVNRYSQLRNEGWYTVEKLLTYYNTNFIGKIGQRFYNQDARLKYTKEENLSFSYLVHGNRLEYTKKWLQERVKYLDSVFEYYTAFDKKASIRTNVNDYLTLRIKSKSPRYIKVKWSDKLNYQKYFIGSDKYYEIRSPVMITNTDNNLDMLGVEDIVEIETFEYLSPSALHLSGMTNITSLIAPNSPRLTEVILEKNTMLQTINLKGCLKLGLNQLEQPTGALNVVNCSNLKYIDISDTSLAALSVIDIDTENPDASQAIGTGALEYFDASNTSITDITIWNQTYLDRIQISNCLQLATINVGNCERLTTLTMPNSQINSFTIVDCLSLTDIDISNTAKLVNLRLDGCPNLLALKMRQINSTKLVELDLTTVPKLNYLDIGNCSFLQRITFAEGFKSLKTFILDNSVLTSVRYGKRGEFPAYLDLAPLALAKVNFYNCPKLQEIRNLNYDGAGSGVFYNCMNLHTITGKLKVNGNIDRIFYNCQKLTHLPTLDFRGATSGSESFMNAKAFTRANLIQIMNAFSANLTSTYRFFANCTAIEGELPVTFFAKATHVSSLNEFFIGCTGIIGAIPTDFFKPLGTRLQNTRYMFSSTKVSGDIDPQWFTSNTSLNTTTRMFNGCTGLTGVMLESFFATNQKLVDIGYMFAGCTGIQTRIPARLFKNHRTLRVVEGLFSGCTGLYGEIPGNLFQADDMEDYAITNTRYLFSGCRGLYGAISGDFFKYCPNLLNVDGTFQNTDIYGVIPDNMFINNRKLSTAASVFSGCTALEGPLPPTIFRNLTALSDVSGFFEGCSNINSEIPNGFLQGCQNLIKVSRLFKNCQQLYGAIPEDLLSHTGNIEEIAYLFENCYNLTSSIPPKIFEKCSKTKDMSAVFKRAWRLSDAIPEGLFDNCINVRTIDSIFSDCKGLGDRFISEENPYAIPEGLFDNCPNLETVNSAFQMWGDIGGGSQLKGQIPERLFEACAKLVNASYLFAGCGGLTGPLASTMFYRSKLLKTLDNAFGGCGNLTLLPDDMFKNNVALTNVKETFRYCNKLKGNAYPFWSGNHPMITSFGGCYSGCTGLKDYSSIPSTWI